MEDSINNLEPLVYDFASIENQVDMEYGFKEIKKNVFEGKIVIIRNVFSSQQIDDFKNKVIAWGKRTSLFPHGESPSKYAHLNYHRIDDGSIPSTCPHLFHQYGFNAIDQLEKEDASLFSMIANRMLEIQNQIAGTSFDISLQGLRLKVLQYPQGGGFLEQHSHPLEPQKIGLILGLSKRGTDFIKGGAAFITPAGFLDTSDSQDQGDIIIFRYDLPHRVSPVDQENMLPDWTLPTGRWSVVLELRETHGLSHDKERQIKE